MPGRTVSVTSYSRSARLDALRETLRAAPEIALYADSQGNVWLGAGTRQRLDDPAAAVLALSEIIARMCCKNTGTSGDSSA